MLAAVERGCPTQRRGGGPVATGRWTVACLHGRQRHLSAVLYGPDTDNCRLRGVSMVVALIGRGIETSLPIEVAEVFA